MTIDTAKQVEIVEKLDSLIVRLDAMLDSIQQLGDLEAANARTEEITENLITLNDKRGLTVEIVGDIVPTWRTDTPYFWGDRVSVYGAVYICREAHRSRIFADDMHKGAWEIEP